MAGRKNAIEERVDRLGEFWNEFALKPEARLLRWLVDQDEARMIDVFVEVQNEDGGDVPDLFIRFDEPFEKPAEYGFALARALRKKYDDDRDGLAAEDLATDWVCPAPRPHESGIQTFVRCCHSLQTHYQSLMVHAVAMLTPASVSSARAWEEWLMQLVRAGLPEHVRVMVVDELGSPGLDRLGEGQPVVQTVKPELEMPAAYLQLASAGVTDRNHPGVAFRRHFIALAQSGGDLVKAKKSADAALSIAAEHNWPQMQVVIHMALGAIYLGVGRIPEAISSYRGAGKIAAAAGDGGDPAAPKLVLQSKLAEGAALVSDGRHPEAASIYREAAALAEKQQDFLMTLEGWRMAAYCHQVSGERELSWRCGHQALSAAEYLDAEGRGNSTLPYVGQGLMRLAGNNDSTAAQALRLRMVALAGPDWERKVETGKLAT